MDLPEPFIPSPFPAATDSVHVCPFCAADLNGEQIPKEYVEAGHYGDRDPELPHYYSRLVGIEVQGHYDGVAEWLCPDCGANWPRAGIRLSPRMQEALDRDLIQRNAQPPDRLSPLSEEG